MPRDRNYSGYTVAALTALGTGAGAGAGVGAGGVNTCTAGIMQRT